MAFLGDAGDTTEVEDAELNSRRVGKLLEDGWYRAALVDDDAKPYDWGTGLSMQFQILNGEYENQRIFDFLCVEHMKSDQAQHIARIRLRELAVATGYKTPDNVTETDPMHGIPVMIQVYRQKDDSGYAESDGKKARVGQYMSVKQWKAEHSEEYMPGVTKEENQPSSPTPIPNNSPTQTDDSDIPF